MTEKNGITSTNRKVTGKIREINWSPDRWYFIELEYLHNYGQSWSLRFPLFIFKN